MTTRPHQASHRPSQLATLALAAILLAPAVAGAEPASQIEDEAPISLSLKAADLGAVLRSFASITGSRLELSPEVRGEVTVELAQVPWAEALDGLCREHALACRLGAGEPPVLRVRPALGTGGFEPSLPALENSIDLSLHGAALSDVLESFAAILKLRPEIADEVRGSVTLEARSMPTGDLLEEVCRLQGCRVEIAAGALHAVAIAPAERAVSPLDLELQDADLHKVLESFGRLPILGTEGVVELELSDDLEGTVTVSLRRLDWAQALEQICRQASCLWRLEGGEPPRLVVTGVDVDLEKPVSLDLGEATLGEAARALAAEAGLALVPLPGTSLDRAVRFEAAGEPWREAITRLCEAGGCRWDVDRASLVLGPASTPLATRAPVGTRAAQVALRLAVPDEAERQVLARFSWSGPLVRLAAGSWRAEVAWIPLGGERGALLPSLSRCGGPPRLGESLWSFEPVAAPLTEDRTLEAGGARLVLAPAGEEHPGARPGGTDSPCEDAEGPRLRVRLRRAPSLDAELALEGLPGRSVLITPPPAAAGSRAEPAAALAVLGPVDGSSLRLTLLQPSTDLAELDSEPFEVGPTSPWERSLDLGAGEPLTVRVELAP